MASEFFFPVAVCDDLSFLNSGTYIVLFHATRIPPHLLIIHHGKFWDLSVKGSNREEELHLLLGFIEKKKVICLFIEWKTGISSDKLIAILNSSFGKYTKAERGKASCLFPIRDSVSAIHGENFSSSNFIFELLPVMNEHSLLGNAALINSEIPNGGKFELLQYDQQHLDEAIELAASKAQKA